MGTPITPLKAPALADLLNALQLAVTYGDKEIPDAEAKQALGRIRGLIATALAKLGEPNEAAIAATRTMFGSMLPRELSRDEWDAVFVRRDLVTTKAMVDRATRDAAAVILHAAVTGEVAGEQWDDGLPCPGCDGAGRIGTMPCDQCKGAGKL